MGPKQGRTSTYTPSAAGDTKGHCWEAPHAADPEIMDTGTDVPSSSDDAVHDRQAEAPDQTGDPERTDQHEKLQV